MKKKSKNLLAFRNWMDRFDIAIHKFRSKSLALFNGKVKLERKNQGNIAGVCQTLGEYFEVNPVYLRIGFIAGTFLSFLTGILLYVLLVVIIPSGRPSAFEFGDPAFRKDTSAKDKDPGVVDLVLCESCNTAVMHNAKFCHHCGVVVGETHIEIS